MQTMKRLLRTANLGETVVYFSILLLLLLLGTNWCHRVPRSRVNGKFALKLVYSFSKSNKQIYGERVKLYEFERWDHFRAASADWKITRRPTILNQWQFDIQSSQRKYPFIDSSTKKIVMKSEWEVHIMLRWSLMWNIKIKCAAIECDRDSICCEYL